MDTIQSISTLSPNGVKEAGDSGNSICQLEAKKLMVKNF